MVPIEGKKWEVRIAALLIFVLGMAAGALSLNLYKRLSAPASEQSRPRLEQTLSRLNLSDDQKRQVEQIFSDARSRLKEVRRQPQPEVAEIRKQTRERLQAVLSPEQWQEFQQMMRGPRERRQQRRSEAKDSQP